MKVRINAGTHPPLPCPGHALGTRLLSVILPAPFIFRTDEQTVVHLFPWSPRRYLKGNDCVDSSCVLGLNWPFPWSLCPSRWGETRQASPDPRAPMCWLARLDEGRPCGLCLVFWEEGPMRTNRDTNGKSSCYSLKLTKSTPSPSLEA